MSENVMSFPGAAAELPENPLQLERKRGFCAHDAVRLDEHSRTITCTACGAALDPFDFLRNSAQTLQSAWDRHRYVNDELRELNDRVTALKKEEARLKARIKTAQAKVGDVVISRGRTAL